MSAREVALWERRVLDGLAGALALVALGYATSFVLHPDVDAIGLGCCALVTASVAFAYGRKSGQA